MSTTFQRPRVVAFFIFTVCVLLVAGVGYILFKYALSQDLIPFFTASQRTQRDVEQTIAAVARVATVPQNETPTVATVTDKQKLENEPFFAQAENDDRVLIYQDARMAYLYRPSSKKLVAIAPLSLATPTLTPAPVPVTTESSDTFTITLYNGTQVSGLTFRAEERFKAANSAVSVIDKANAAQDTYEKSILTIQNQKKASDIQAFAQKFGYEIAPLPSGEKSTSADALLILGKDAE